ncbi:MAG: hypothetical protein WCR54_04095 [Clostridia bacterium]
MESEYKVVQKLDKKKYFNCSMYYLKRYAGIREILLMTVLLAIGLWMYLAYDLILILIFFGITLILLLAAIVLFLITSILGYKHDFSSQNIYYQTLEFFEDKMIVTSQNIGGEAFYSEEHPYLKIDKIAIKRGKIYIYAGVALFYYVYPESIENGSIQDLAQFLKDHIESSKFKIKTTVRRFPKKGKLSLLKDEIEKDMDDEK